MGDGRLQGKVAWYKGHLGDALKDRKTQEGWVYVTDHTYESGGQLSNFVDFTYVNDDGTLSKRTDGDYDYGAENFIKVRTPKLRILGHKRGK